MRLERKSAIVTGGGQGIGRAIALCMAREGSKVCVADLNVDSAKSVSEEIKAMNGEAIFAEVDITDSARVKEVAKETIDTFGTIDILVNNAGWDALGPFVKIEEKIWDKIININFKGPLNCFSAVLPQMVEKKYGKIISIASDAGRVGSTGEAVYSGCKGGIIAFSKTIAREVAYYGININCISPGPTETPMFNEGTADNPKLLEGLKKAIPMRRLGQPEDIAGAVAFLASDEAGYITGQVLSVSGGLTMV